MAEKFRITPLAEDDENFTFQVSSPRNETVVITFTPPHKVSVTVGAGEQEVKKAPEFEPQEITLEGRIARNRWAKYSASKHTYSNRMAFQPDANNTNLAWYFDVEAEGDVADFAWEQLRLNQAGEAVVVSGWLIKEDVSEKTKGLIKADFIGKLPAGQKPRHTILHERVNPSDRSTSS